MKMTTSATVLGEVVAIRPLGWAARDVAVATRKLADEVLDATTTDVVTAQRVLVVILLGLVRPVADAVRAMVAASSTARSAKAGTVVATVLRRLRLDGRLQRESCLGSWQLPCRILIRPLSSVKSHARRKRFSRNGTQKPASNVSNARSAPLFRQRLRRARPQGAAGAPVIVSARISKWAGPSSCTASTHNSRIHICSIVEDVAPPAPVRPMLPPSKASRIAAWSANIKADGDDFSHDDDTVSRDSRDSGPLRSALKEDARERARIQATLTTWSKLLSLSRRIGPPSFMPTG